MSTINKFGPLERMEVDKHITQLMQCKPVSENEIKLLSEKVFSCNCLG